MNRSTPKTMVDHLAGSRPDYYDNPPEGYIAMWRLVERLRDGSIFEKEAAALSTYWRRKDLWPDYPAHFYTALDELTESDSPTAYAASLQGENSDVLLRFLSGYIQTKQWIGGDLILETHSRTWNLRNEEDKAWIESCRAAVVFEQVKRTVPQSVWDEVEMLRIKHWSTYPQNANWGGFKELALYVRGLNREAAKVAKYQDRPQVVAAKVGEIVEGKRRFWEDRRERADAEAIRDNTITHNQDAEIAERDAKLAEFTYLLYRDYLEGRFNLEKKAIAAVKEPTKCVRNWSIKEQLLYWMLQHPDVNGDNTADRIIASHVPLKKKDENGEIAQRSPDDVSKRRSGFISGDPHFTKRSYELVYSALESGKKVKNHALLEQVKRHMK